MKELSLNQMASIEGGSNCGLNILLAAATMVVLGALSAITVGAATMALAAAGLNFATTTIACVVENYNEQ
jgi:bacteriocin-like protein